MAKQRASSRRHSESQVDFINTLTLCRCKTYWMVWSKMEEVWRKNCRCKESQKNKTAYSCVPNIRVICKFKNRAQTNHNNSTPISLFTSPNSLPPSSSHLPDFQCRITTVPSVGRIKLTGSGRNNPFSGGGGQGGKFRVLCIPRLPKLFSACHKCNPHRLKPLPIKSKQ